MDAVSLYRHVQLTTAKLGIPTPARAHVRKIGDGTVYIEHLSCHPAGLKKLELAIETAGELRNTELGLIAIHCSGFPNLRTRLPSQSFQQSSLNFNHSLPESPFQESQATGSTAPEIGTLLTRISEGRFPERQALPVSPFRRADDPNFSDAPPMQSKPYLTQTSSEAPFSQSFSQSVVSLAAPISYPPQSASLLSVTNSIGSEKKTLLTRISDTSHLKSETLRVSDLLRAADPNLSNTPTQPASSSAQFSKVSPFPPHGFNQSAFNPSSPIPPLSSLPSQKSARSLTAPEMGTLITRISDGRHLDEQALPITHSRRADDPNISNAPMQSKSLPPPSNASESFLTFSQRVSSPTPTVSHRTHSPPEAHTMNSTETGTLLTRISDRRRPDGHRVAESNFPNAPMQPKSSSRHGNASEASPSNQRVSSPIPPVSHRTHSSYQAPTRNSTASGTGTLLTRISDGRRPNGLTGADDSNFSNAQMQPKSISSHSKASEVSPTSNQRVSSPIPPVSHRTHSPSQAPERNLTSPETGTLLTRISDGRRPDGQTPPVDDPCRAEDGNLYNAQTQPRSFSAYNKVSDASPSFNQSAFSSTPPVYRPSHPLSQSSSRNSSAAERATLLTRISDNRPDGETLPVNYLSRADEPFDARKQSSPSAPETKRSESPHHERNLSLTVHPKPSLSMDSNSHSPLTRAPPKAEHDFPTSPALYSTSLSSHRRSGLPLKARISLGDDEGIVERPELPLKERISAGIGQRLLSGPIRSQVDTYPLRTVPKREPEAEGEESGEQIFHKRRKLDNVLSQSEDSSQQDVPTSRTNSKIFSTPLDLGGGREDRAADLQKLQQQVSELERELTRERNEIEQIHHELEKERRKRVRAELIVEDVRREMREPFIVPSLLDAFISITDISNVSMEHSP